MNQDLYSLPEQMDQLLHERQQLWNRHDLDLPQINRYLNYCQSQSINTPQSPWTGIKNNLSQQGIPHYDKIQHHLNILLSLHSELGRINRQIRTSQLQTQTKIQQLNGLLETLRKRWNRFWMLILIMTAITLLFVL